MQQMKKWIIAYKIEYLWKKIRNNRRKMRNLIENKEPYNSPQLVKLNTMNWELWWTASQMERLWMQYASD